MKFLGEVAGKEGVARIFPIFQHWFRLNHELLEPLTTPTLIPTTDFGVSTLSRTMVHVVIMRFASVVQRRLSLVKTATQKGSAGLPGWTVMIPSKLETGKTRMVSQHRLSALLLLLFRPGF